MGAECLGSIPATTGELPSRAFWGWAPVVKDHESPWVGGPGAMGRGGPVGRVPAAWGPQLSPGGLWCLLEVGDCTC